MKKQNNKTLILTFSGIAVFVIGAVLGSFLVLRSHTGEGKEFYIKNTSSSNQAVSGTSLLAELRKKSGTSFYEEFNGNLTEEFVAVMIEESVRTGKSIDELSIDFFEAGASAAKKQEVNIFPDVSEDSITISGTKKISEYLEEMNPHYAILSDAFIETYETSANELDAANKKTALFRRLKSLIVSTDSLTDVEVPQAQVQLHKDVISFSIALRRIIEEGLLQMENDPIASLLILKQMEAVYTEGERIDKQIKEIIADQ